MTSNRRIPFHAINMIVICTAPYQKPAFTAQRSDDSRGTSPQLQIDSDFSTRLRVPRQRFLLSQGYWETRRGHFSCLLGKHLLAVLNPNFHSVSKSTRIICEAEEPGDGCNVTYSELLREVCSVANVPKSFGIKKGDTVTIYLPMTWEAIAAFLACTRIGVIHSLIFSGFSAESLHNRVQDCGSHVLITSNEGKRGGKTIATIAIVDAALKECPDFEHAVVLKRTGMDVSFTQFHQKWWHEEIAKVPTIALLKLCAVESVNIFDPPPRPHDAPFPRDEGMGHAQAPSAQNEQRLFVGMPSTLTAVSPGSTAETFLGFPWSPPPPFASTSPIPAYYNSHRRLPHVEHSRDDVSDLASRIGFNEGHPHVHRCRLDAAVSLHNEPACLSMTFRELQSPRETYPTHELDLTL